MKKYYHSLKCLILLATLSLASCGYLSDKPPVNIDLYKIDDLQACKIDINKLGEIFKADQKQQIRCLEENFIQFTKYVRSKNQGSVTESELNAFIRKFFEGQSDSIVKGLGLIFQLNMLLLRDEADRISNTNISPLFNLLVHVNQEAIVITQVLKEISDEKNQGNYWELRSKFNESVARFSRFTIEIIEKSPGLQQKLNIKTFILDASKKLGNKEISPDTIDSLIFLKRILVAGDKEVITSDELRLLIDKLPKILSLSFDLYFVKSTNFPTDSERARFYLTNIRDLQKTINFDQAPFDLFTIDQILGLIQEFVKDVDVKKFNKSVVSLKSRVIGGKKDSFSLADLETTLNIAHDLAEKSYFNNVTYNAYEETLKSPRPIEYLPRLKQPVEYSVFSDRRVTELHNEFLDIAVNFRFFRTKKEGIATYGNDIKRNKYGFQEASIIKWLSIKLLKGYGHKNALGQLQVNEKEFKLFLDEMRPILEEFKLWSPNPDTFAFNAVLLADLFQNTSNGDLEVNVTEASEYIQMILTAVQISNQFNHELSRNSDEGCDGGPSKDDPVFSTECYNKHFFDTVLNKLDYKKFFPRLNEYVENSPKSEVDQYLLGVEGFARDNPNPELPINKRDSILTLGALLNIESTFIRFDINRDSIIDYDELVDAFSVYRPAIITLAKLKPGDEGYALSIFLYMVSKMEVPPTGSWLNNAKFAAFDSCVTKKWCRERFMDKVEAKRLNIGKLLYYMVNQNKAALKTAAKETSKDKTLRSLVSGLFHHSEQVDEQFSDLQDEQ